MPPKRVKLAAGVWKDASGISVVVRCGKVYAERRYPAVTPLRDLKEHRDALRVELRAQRDAGTLRRPKRSTTLREDAPVYLKAVRALKTYKERRNHINIWVALFGDRNRLEIQPHEIQAQRDKWRMDGKAASTVNHYLRALSNLYRVLDPRGENPVRHVAECDEPESVPRAIPAPIVKAIFAAMTPSQTRARLAVLATTGIEQATFAEIAATDVDLEAATVRVPRRKKGQSAHARLLPLTPAAVRAFKDVATWDAWGGYSKSSAHKTFRRACVKVELAHNTGKPKAQHISLAGLRPKDLRHTFGTEISLATDGNTATVAAFLGHATSAMADRYRSAAIPQHLREAAAKLSLRPLGTNQEPEESGTKDGSAPAF